MDDGPEIAYPSHRPPAPAGRQTSHTTPSFPQREEPPIYPPAQNGPPSGNYPNQLPSGMEQRRPETPPPPPPPANAGFIPSFFPGISRLPESYVNLPNSGRTAAHGGGVSGFGAGIGAGALAAGAVIFGDDFLWAQDFPPAFGGR